MKVLIEAIYRLESEPALFSSVEASERTVYIWSTKRAYLEPEKSYCVVERQSIFTEQPSLTGCIEVWNPATEQTDPPKKPDDSWTETVKQIQLEQVQLEWHPLEHQIRLSWQQSRKSLEQGLLLSHAQQQILQLGLEFPPLPSLLP